MAAAVHKGYLLLLTLVVFVTVLLLLLRSLSVRYGDPYAAVHTGDLHAAVHERDPHVAVNKSAPFFNTRYQKMLTQLGGFFENKDEDEGKFPYRKPKWITVLYWTDWYGEPWSSHYRDEGRLGESGCPEQRCTFTYDRSTLGTADYVFITHVFDRYDLPAGGRGWPGQRWVYAVVENPLITPTGQPPVSDSVSSLFDWLLSYNTGAEVPSYYGYLRPLDGSPWPTGRANLMDPTSASYRSYLAALKAGKTLLDLPEEVPRDLRQQLGALAASFSTRKKLAAFMSSHCPVNSQRMRLTNALNAATDGGVAVYGSCGNMTCRDRHPTDPWCWQHELAPNYFFYLSLENTVCEEYITEKVYNPLVHGLVPLVYGGANYSRFLPPGSYIDILQYTPNQLAALLRQLSSNSTEYARYHLWRAYWRPLVGGSSCDVCRALHRGYPRPRTPRTPSNLQRWRQAVERCHLPPADVNSWFPRS